MYKQQHSVILWFSLIIMSVIMLQTYAETISTTINLTEITTVDGNISRTDYINDLGVICNSPKTGYATKLITKTATGEFEEYFDENGEPALKSMGYCSLFREFDEDGRNIKTTYLGAEREPVTINYGYANVIRTYNEDSRIHTERYFDTEGNPVCSTVFGYCRLFEYGKCIRVTYLDENEHPMMTQLGYAIIEQYDAEPTIGIHAQDEFYYDSEFQHIALSHNEFGTHKEYNEDGLIQVITYLGQDGAPIVSKSGYTTVVRTFYPNNSIETEFYYDSEGQPTALSEGQYGIRRINGNIVYLDVNGNEQFNLKRLFYGNTYLTITAAVALVLFSSITNKKMNILLLMIYFVAVLYITVMFRQTGSAKINLIPFWSYQQILSNREIRMEIISNILLFVPLGAFLYKIHPHLRVILILVFISSIIELIQYLLGIGLCETDDVINNGAGGLIGFFVCKRLSKSMLLSFFREKTIGR